MSDPERITVLAETFSAAALEYHRKKMKERGYRVASRIDASTFERVKDDGSYESFFDQKPMFAITFVKESAKESA